MNPTDQVHATAEPVGPGESDQRGGVLAGAGAGAAAGILTGGVAGWVAGPIGGMLGAMVGGMVGCAVGAAAGSVIPQESDHDYWRSHHRLQPYAGEGDFERYLLAYYVGSEGYHEGESFEAAEGRLQAAYERCAQADQAPPEVFTRLAPQHAFHPLLPWSQARVAAQAAHARRAAMGTG